MDDGLIEIRVRLETAHYALQQAAKKARFQYAIGAQIEAMALVVNEMIDECRRIELTSELP